MRNPVVPLSRAEVHRRALLAAAAVALGTSSCGEATLATPSSADAQAGSDAAEVVASPDAAGDASAVTDAEDATTAVDASGKPDCSAVAAADLAACCDKLRAWCDAALGVGTEAANTCHYGPGFDASTGCTPWGPPAPPAWTAPEALA